MKNNGKSEKGKGMNKDNRAIEESRIKYFILKHPLLSAFIISFFVILAFFVFYSGYSKEKRAFDFSLLSKIISFQDPLFSSKEINKLVALAGLTLLSFAFLPGPISRIFPKLSFLLVLRKPIGLIGFLLIFIHYYISFHGYYYKGNLYNALFNNPKVIAFIAASISFFIFFLMAITSTKKAVEILTYKRWKLLQRTGYIALLLAVIHFVVIETKPDKGLDIRPFGYVALIIPILTIILRVYVHMKGLGKERKRYEEHFIPT